MRKTNFWFYISIILVMLMIVGVKIENSIQGNTKEDTNNGFVSFFDERYNENTQLNHIDRINNSMSDVMNDKLQNEIKLNAKYALLMDGTNRRVLYNKDGEKQVPMASTTKIMTLLVALENGNPEQVVHVSSYAARMPKVHLGMHEGEQYRLKDLFYSLMLESHNDSAVAIAEAIGGSVEGFAKLMNDKAKSLGANHTHFVTPNGLDDKNHYTTAYDLALITCAALENQQFVNIIQTKQYSFHEQSRGRYFTVNNQDRYLDMDPYAIGVKTGFTGNAGYCFVGAIRQKDRMLVSVVLASNWPPRKNDKWKDTKALMDYGKTQFDYRTLIPQNKCFSPIKVERSIENIPVVPIIKDQVDILIGEKEKVSYRLHLPDCLEAPIAAEQPIGRLEVLIDNVLYKSYPVVASEERHRIVYSYVIKKVLFKWLPR